MAFASWCRDGTFGSYRGGRGGVAGQCERCEILRGALDSDAQEESCCLFCHGDASDTYVPVHAPAPADTRAGDAGGALGASWREHLRCRFPEERAPEEGRPTDNDTPSLPTSGPSSGSTSSR